MKKLMLLFAGLFMAAIAFADDTPQFPGGKAALDKYIADNLQYPPMARENGIEGAVDVGFMVLSDGSIGTIKIMRMVDPDLESEAIRLVKNMPKWIPADKNGTPVDAQTQIEILFLLTPQ